MENKWGLMSELGVVIPTYNAGGQLEQLLTSLIQQEKKLSKIIIIDSTSTDGTPELVRRYGIELHTIRKEDFRHGTTRQLGCDLMPPDIDIICFLTQDVTLQGGQSIAHLEASLRRHPRAGAAYGRQLPRENATCSARLQRQFNYPATSIVKTMQSRAKLGIKTTFLSDSFAMYRRDALQAVGGFPSEVTICEDMYVGAKLLLAGYEILYDADACVYHSHNDTWRNIWRRYQAIGAFHREQPWIRETFGGNEKEGWRLLRYQLSQARRLGGYPACGYMILENTIKYLAYIKGIYSVKMTVT